MNHIETKKITVGLILTIGLIGLTGCTQFQDSVAHPGDDASSGSNPDNTSLSTPGIHRAGLVTTAAQISMDFLKALQDYSPSSGTYSCDGSGVCTLAVAPEETFGSFASLSSASFTDYRGESLGGGYEFAMSFMTGSGTFSEPGIRLHNTSSTGFDFASRTVTALNVAADQVSGSIVVEGGEIELIDNTNEYVASLAATHLTFDNTCKCPVSGSLDGTLSGSFAGSISLTFNSCGSITIDAAGESTTATVSSCN